MKKLFNQRHNPRWLSGPLPACPAGRQFKQPITPNACFYNAASATRNNCCVPVSSERRLAPTRWFERGRFFCCVR